MLYETLSKLCCCSRLFLRCRSSSSAVGGFTHLRGCCLFFSSRVFNKSIGGEFSSPRTLQQMWRSFCCTSAVSRLSCSSSSSYYRLAPQSNDEGKNDAVLCSVDKKDRAGMEERKLKVHKKDQENETEKVKNKCSASHFPFCFLPSRPLFSPPKGEGEGPKCLKPREEHLPDRCGERDVESLNVFHEKTKELMKEVKRVAHRELRAEVERDAKDGGAAIPPLTPVGWSVQHDPGTRFFFMQRVIPAKLPRTGSSHGLSFSDERPKFRSVLEEALQRHQKTSKGNGRNSDSGTPQKDWKEKQGRDEVLPYLSSVLPSAKNLSFGSTAFPRLDTHLMLYVPFQVQDLSLQDPKVPITEWSRFDLYVRKASCASSLSYPFPHQRRVLEDRECMLFRLASVQSELRIRAVQFLSQPVERKLAECAAFGQGDPMWLTIEARRRQHLQRQAQTENREKSPAGLDLKDPSMQGGTRGILSTFKDRRMTPQLLEDKTPIGEFARAMVYHGPYCSSLSVELRDALLQYISDDLGITNDVVEYICQMQYFIEQEEYMGWLARLGMTADCICASLK